MKKFLLALWRALSHNLGLKILALASAFIIWVAVVNSQDPIDTISFYNVPVKVLNEDALRQKDKIPEIVYGNTVAVTIQARKSICDKLTSDDIIATADYEKIYVTDTVPIEVSVKGYDESDVEIIRGQNNYMKLTLEDYATKEFKIRVVTVGTPAPGYVVGQNTASPNVITIRGSKLQISRIQAVIATVNVDDMSADREVIAHPIIFDMNDEPISNANLELSADSVNVSTTLYRTKDITLEAVPFGEPAEGYEIKSISSQPSKITVAGAPEDLAKLGSRLRAYVDVTGRTHNAESNIDINSLIDSKLSTISIVDEDYTLAVTAYIDTQDVREVGITAQDVAVDSLASDLAVEIVSVSAARLSVRVKKEVGSALGLVNLRPHIDLSEFTEEGTYDIPLITEESTNYKVMNPVTVRVKLKKIETPEPAGALEQ